MYDEEFVILDSLMRGDRDEFRILVTDWNEAVSTMARFRRAMKHAADGNEVAKRPPPYDKISIEHESPKIVRLRRNDTKYQEAPPYPTEYPYTDSELSPATKALVETIALHLAKPPGDPGASEESTGDAKLGSAD